MKKFLDALKAFFGRIGAAFAAIPARFRRQPKTSDAHEGAGRPMFAGAQAESSAQTTAGVAKAGTASVAAAEPAGATAATTAGAANKPAFAEEPASVTAAVSSVDDIAAKLMDPGTSFYKPPAATSAAEAAQPGEPAVTAAEPAKPAGPVALPPVVEFRGVSKTYPNGFTAIKDVTFTVEDIPGKGEFICVLGPSGCGKSTILRLIAGLAPQYPATQGEVLVAGRPVDGPGADRGMVFQDYTSFDNRTVVENIAFGLECRGVPKGEREERALEWVGKVGLSRERDAYKYPHQLSGGMRQRVAIARSLILSPRIILMDEPFGALDPRTRLNMQDLLVALTREVEATLFFITHSIEEAVYLGDRTFIMSSAPGTILQQIAAPAPEAPARVVQQQPAFLKTVFDIRNTMETLESSTRAGDQ